MKPTYLSHLKEAAYWDEQADWLSRDRNRKFFRDAIRQARRKAAEHREEARLLREEEAA